MTTFAELHPYVILLLGASVFFFILGGVFYLGIISPVLCKYWLIPQIEKRYQQKVIFDKKRYRDGPLLPLPWIGTGMMENAMCRTIVIMYFGWDGWLKEDRLYNGLCKINYNVKTASKAELIVAFTTTFCPVVIVGGPCLVIYLLKYLGV